MGRVHAAAARENGARIVAVADEDAGRARILASRFGARAVTPEELFVRGAADVAHVCTPPASHRDACESALSSGMHVLCEKPLTRTAGELESLFDIAQANDLLLCPVHQFPMQRGVRRILARRDAIGKIRNVSAEICTAGADGTSDEARHWIALDILPHPLSLSSAFGAAPLARAEWNVSITAPGEMAITAVSGDILLSFLVSTRGRPTSNQIRIIGDAGTATADLFHGYSYIERGRVSRFRKFVRPFAGSGLAFAHAATNGMRRAVEGETSFPGLRTLVDGFYKAIANRALPPITPSECLDIALARDAIIALSLAGLSRAQSRSGAASSR